METSPVGLAEHLKAFHERIALTEVTYCNYTGILDGNALGSGYGLVYGIDIPLSGTDDIVFGKEISIRASCEEKSEEKGNAR